MNKGKQKHRKAPVGKILLSVALCLMIGGYFAMPLLQGTEYVITDGETVLEIDSKAGRVEEVLAEAGVSLSESDEVTVTGGSRKTHMVIRRGRQVTVNRNGEAMTAVTYDTSVGQLLEEMNIVLESGDTLTSGGGAVSLAEETWDGMVLDISSQTLMERSELVPVPYETVTYLDPTLEQGTSRVETAGVEGVNQLLYQDTYVAGERTDSVLLNTVVMEVPVDEVILVGSKETLSQGDVMLEEYVEPEPEPEPVKETAASIPAPKQETATPTTTPTYTPEPEYTAPSTSGNTITTASGEVIQYSYSLSVTATAYTGGGITATGTNARYGAIAVDPKVIPYGTRMYIVSDDGKYIYGYATAEDCGGAIKGNKIDLYYDSYDTCIQFGRRTCTVYILD